MYANYVATCWQVNRKKYFKIKHREPRESDQEEPHGAITRGYIFRGADGKTNGTSRSRLMLDLHGIMYNKEVCFPTL